MKTADGNAVVTENAASGRLQVTPLAQVTVSGEGFVPGSTVVVEVHSTPTHLGNVTVAGDGTFAATLQLPSSLAFGDHTLVATGSTADGDLVLNTPLTLALEDELPKTGGSFSATPAFAMLLAGSLMLLASRRRQLV